MFEETIQHANEHQQTGVENKKPICERVNVR